MLFIIETWLFFLVGVKENQYLCHEETIKTRNENGKKRSYQPVFVRLARDAHLSVNSVVCCGQYRVTAVVPPVPARWSHSVAHLLFHADCCL